jgi:DNA-binding transcriptional regulator YhcF (GntR family)
MEEQGLIFTEGNLPSRITKDEQVLKMVREELILEAVDAFVHSVRSINLPLHEALTLVQNTYERE